jgi:hypothetical protein
MNNDKNIRDTDRTDQAMRDRNAGNRTMQRQKSERCEIGNEEIDDDAMVDEASRSDLGAGE